MFVEVNGTRLYVERHGTGTPLLFIHGSTLDHRMWRAQVESLASHHETITYDLRGHGQSAVPTGPFAGYEDAAALLEHLGVERTVVIGHSVGALYALELTVARPDLVAGCALICMGGLGDPPFPADLRALVGEIRTAAAERGVEAAKAIWAASSLFTVAREQPSVRAELDAMLADYRGWGWLNTSPAFNLVPPVVERLESISVPTLVVDGERDHAYNHATAAVLARRIPNATLLRVPDAGHMASMEASSVVTSAISKLAAMLLVCLLVLVAACTSGSPPSSAAAQVSAPAPTPTAAPLLDIRPITITFGGRPIARLLADGRTEAVGQNPPGSPMSPGPTLNANGTIQLAKGGLTARISREGDLYVSNPGRNEQLFGRIIGDHLAIGDGKNGVHVNGDMMVFDNGRDDVGKIEGTVDAGMRRTALVMFAAFLIDQSVTP